MAILFAGVPAMATLKCCLQVSIILPHVLALTAHRRPCQGGGRGGAKRDPEGRGEGLRETPEGRGAHVDGFKAGGLVNGHVQHR